MSARLPAVTRIRALAAIVVLLASAALYEALVALQVIPMGKLAGGRPFGGEVVLLIALLALLAALVVSLSGASNAGSVWRSAALVVAVFIVVGLAVSAAVGGIGELIALLVLLTGIVASLAYASGRSAERISVAPLVAPAAAAFVVARFYSFDDYYLPTLRRMSDHGAVPGQWIIVLVALALLAAVATKIRPRLGTAMTSLVLFISVLTSIAMGVGH
jgi:hypothetical protein